MKWFDMTSKRANILHQLYRKTGLDLADFMDKTDLSFKELEVNMSGRCGSISERELKGFAKGFDMNVEELLTYLELSDFF
ncbi:hypothetical protein LJC56_01815 [Christensenellaceae bacterium OttesenSCG-928-K19]|nr:hypothetical protein [Christensenellaceae bacterium OttesenSCG-928-K19]